MPEDIDLEFLIQETFLGYKYRKQNNRLYSTDSLVPKKLISMYFSEENERPDFDLTKKGFVNRYIKGESFLEGVTDHEQEEIQGLEIMYEHIHELPKEEFEMFSIIQLHRDLYSKCPFPEAGGRIRNRNVYLPGTGTETCDYTDIFDNFLTLEPEVSCLMDVATTMRESGDYSNIFAFIDRCLRLKSALIKIHPFEDGNGRTVRCFINRIFEEAGIPPVYIKANERTEYHIAMNKANNEGDFSTLHSFYLYKICDSIVELDINERMRQEVETMPSYRAKERQALEKRKVYRKEAGAENVTISQKPVSV